MHEKLGEPWAKEDPHATGSGESSKAIILLTYQGFRSISHIGL